MKEVIFPRSEGFDLVFDVKTLSQAVYYYDNNPDERHDLCEMLVEHGYALAESFEGNGLVIHPDFLIVDTL